MMKYERFTWKTEKLQHLDDEVIMVVDNANKDWKGHILNIVDMLNDLNDERMMYKTTIDKRIVELEEENERMRQFITKGKRLSVKELMENTNENELLKKKIRGLEKENEQLKEQVQILNKCCRLKLSDEAIKQAYADLNRREREKHSQGNAAHTAKINQNEVIY